MEKAKVVSRSPFDYRKATEKAVKDRLIVGKFRRGNTFLINKCRPIDSISMWITFIGCLIFGFGCALLNIFTGSSGYTQYAPPLCILWSLIIFLATDSFYILDFEKKAICQILILFRTFDIAKFKIAEFKTIKGLGIQTIIFGKSAARMNNDVTLWGEEPTDEEREEKLVDTRSSCIAILSNNKIILFSEAAMDEKKCDEYKKIVNALSEIINVPYIFAEKSQKLAIGKDEHNNPCFVLEPFLNSKEAEVKKAGDKRVKLIGQIVAISFLAFLFYVAAMTGCGK